jgi:hypothetical protein
LRGTKISEKKKREINSIFYQFLTIFLVCTIWETREKFPAQKNDGEIIEI